MYYLEQPEKASTSKHRTYSIKDGDTLASVSKVLGIPARELRRYHNTYCPIEDLIEADFKSHLEVVLLPIENSSIKQDETYLQPKVAFGPNYKLPFLPEMGKTAFKVSYSIQVGDSKDDFEIKMTVACLAVDANKFHLFEINREDQILINGEAPDTMMEELAAKVSAVIYPLKIVVDQTGRWIDVYNYDAIVKRWQESKVAILDYYEGEVVATYLRFTDDTLESKEALIEALRSDYFLRSYFNGIHVGYTSELSFTNEVAFPLEKNVESVYTVVQKVHPYVELTNQVFVEQEGDYKDTNFDLRYDDEPAKGAYKAKYLLNKKSFSIEKAVLECSIYYDEPIKITVAITHDKTEQ